MTLDKLLNFYLITSFHLLYQVDHQALKSFFFLINIYIFPWFLELIISNLLSLTCSPSPTSFPLGMHPAQGCQSNLIMYLPPLQIFQWLPKRQMRLLVFKWKKKNSAFHKMLFLLRDLDGPGPPHLINWLCSLSQGREHPLHTYTFTHSLLFTIVPDIAIAFTLPGLLSYQLKGKPKCLFQFPLEALHKEQSWGDCFYFTFCFQQNGTLWVLSTRGGPSKPPNAFS